MVRFNVSDVVFKMDVNFQCCVIQSDVLHYSDSVLLSFRATFCDKFIYPTKRSDESNTQPTNNFN